MVPSKALFDTLVSGIVCGISTFESFTQSSKIPVGNSSISEPSLNVTPVSSTFPEKALFPSEVTLSGIFNSVKAALIKASLPIRTIPDGH